MRAARTDKFVFQVKRNPSLSVGMRSFALIPQALGARGRRQLPQKEQDIRTKRQARSGRDKSDSSPGSPCCLRVSQLSERASFRCVRRTNLQRSGVRSGRQDLSAVFSVKHRNSAHRHSALFFLSGGLRSDAETARTHTEADFRAADGDGVADGGRS